MIGVVCFVLVGLVLSVVTMIGITTGEMPLRINSVNRAENPSMFWFATACYGSLALISFAAAIRMGL